MREQIERYTRRLEGLSTLELSRSAEKLVSFERRNGAALIAHLAEISRRKGHLELGYKSLFHYCLEHLRLGEGSVWKRTQVAGVARRFPQVLEHLAQGKANLSVLAILAPHLTEENVDRLLKEAEGKTTREAKEIVAALDPKPAAESRIRRKPVRSREESAEATNARAAMAAPSEETGRPATPERCFATRETERKLEGTLEVARPEVYNFRFSAGKGLKEKLERLAEVLGIENAARHMPEILEQALDLALEKKDPKKKLERRQKREAARRETPPEEVEKKREGTAREARAGSRYIRSSVRERVLERASYQCEYTGPGGVRCTARAGLEIDHIDPYVRGGAGSGGNLRALCRAHNLFSAARDFGEDFMRGKIEGTAENRSSRWKEESRGLLERV